VSEPRKGHQFTLSPCLCSSLGGKSVIFINVLMTMHGTEVFPRLHLDRPNTAQQAQPGAHLQTQGDLLMTSIRDFAYYVTCVFIVLLLLLMNQDWNFSAKNPREGGCIITHDRSAQCLPYLLYNPLIRINFLPLPMHTPTLSIN
jgi:hypothetical protein